MIGTVVPIEPRGADGAADDPLLSPAGRYLVGFDGSQASAMALRWAADRASAGTAELVLVGVAEEQQGGQEHGGREDFAAMLLRRAQDLRERDGRLAVSTRITSGDVAASLAHAGQPGDVLVVGSDKTGYAQGRIYGFRSIQLAASVTGILVVVPAVDLRMRSGVVVGLDDAARGLELVRISAREAWRHRAPLLLVHAVPHGSSAERRSRGERVLARALQTAWEEAPVDVTSHLIERRPAEAILNLSRDRALLVVGRSPRGGPVGLGPTLHELLMNANVPTAIVP